MANGKPSLLLSKIPPARDICDSLGFYGSKANSNLSEFARKWRKDYVGSCGRLGTEILDWNSEQKDLKIMAEAFLSTVRKEEFWSSVKGDSECHSDERTLELLTQLLWKQNRYSDYNTKYTHKQSRKRYRRTSETHDDDIRQIKRQKIAENQTPNCNISDVHEIIANDRFIKRAAQQNHSSLQRNHAQLPLSPPETDAGALPPAEFQSPHVQHASIIKTSQPKNHVLIPFYIVSHGSGITRHSFWEEGRFGSRSLEEFVTSCAEKLKCTPDNIERIELVLRLKTLKIDFGMDVRSESIWRTAMAAFKKEVKLANDKGEIMEAKVLVEPKLKRDGLEIRDWEEDDDFVL